MNIGSALTILLALLLSLSHRCSLPLDGRSQGPARSGNGKAIVKEENKNNMINNDEYDEVDFLPAKVICELNGYPIPAIIDTGAQITIMSSSCARRCRIANLIDTKYACRAIGVGSSEIIGRIDSLPLRIGPVSFQSRVAILRDSPVDFLIGMDFLRRFQSDLCLSEGVLKLRVRDRPVRVPLVSTKRDLKDYQDQNLEIDDDSDGFEDDQEINIRDEMSDSSTSPSNVETTSRDPRRKVNIYSMKASKPHPEHAKEQGNKRYATRLSMEGV